MNILKKKEKLQEKLAIHNKNTIKLCHNDLNNLNIFIKKDEPVILIDYDYVAYNFIAF